MTDTPHKVRLTFDLTPEQHKRFEALRDEVSLENNADLFNVVMSLMNWAVVESSKRRRIGAFNEETDAMDHTLIMPALEAARRNGPFL